MSVFTLKRRYIYLSCITTCPPDVPALASTKAWERVRNLSLRIVKYYGYFKTRPNTRGSNVDHRFSRFHLQCPCAASTPSSLPPTLTCPLSFFTMASRNDRYRVFESRTLTEEAWSNREELFKAHGYHFRPRLRKGWTPSWLNTDKTPMGSEDGHLLRV